VKEHLRAAGKAVPFVLVMIILAVGAIWILNQLEAGAQERATQHAEIVALQAGLQEANARLEAQGEQPVDVPVVETGDEPPVVPIAPTQEQILAAFDVWCDLRSCRGDDGDDAPPMTRAQIFAGFTAWCSTDPRCVGKDGSDSTVPGPPGRAPTPEEILAAVEVVCADGACDGEDGTNGKDGRGIADTECHTTGDWIITYDDGTASTRPGPCRVMETSPSPSPAPTPTPMKGR
jgi:hypothetical protein